MTEEEWLHSTDPAPMLECFAKKPDERKLRLFVIACCGRISHFLDDGRVRGAVGLIEECADGVLSVHELWKKQEQLGLNDDDELLGRLTASTGYRRDSIQHALFAVSLAMGLMDARQAAGVARWTATSVGAEGLGERGEQFEYGEQDEYREAARPFTTVEYEGQANLLREIFGNPFRPVAFDPRWRTSDVVGLARAIYDDKAFERMPILADALMDAGCEDEQVISHCRGDGPHVRGCWVVDLILGKE